MPEVVRRSEVVASIRNLISVMVSERRRERALKTPDYFGTLVADIWQQLDDMRYKAGNSMVAEDNPLLYMKPEDINLDAIKAALDQGGQVHGKVNINRELAETQRAQFWNRFVEYNSVQENPFI